MNRTLVLALSAAAAVLAAAPVAAQNYPTKPVKFVTPYPPGGTTDILARLIGTKLQQSLGQPFLVESKAGAGGNVGTDSVAKAPGDGYTILMGASGPLAINVSLFKNLPYNPEKDLAPVVHVASVPLVLVVHQSFPAKNVKELLALLKAKPDGYSYASAGNGTPQHLSAELFKQLTGTKMVHVPYKGSGPAINDLVGGQVPIAFESLIPILPQLKGGKLRPLAVTSLKRSALLPDVPTLDESGVKGYESIAWYGVVAPGKTPKPIVDKLNAEMVKALRDPDIKQRLAEMGSAEVAGSPEKFGALIKAEIAKWAPVVKASGATID
ncbi:MAG: Bug family tripartite tricarboxylate transporter substrate binding protein [Bacteroidota bacterium]|jgi:tripartite-type tricarboxylate transporter receptor subunit TctC